MSYNFIPGSIVKQAKGEEISTYPYEVAEAADYEGIPVEAFLDYFDHWEINLTDIDTELLRGLIGDVVNDYMGDEAEADADPLSEDWRSWPDVYVTHNGFIFYDPNGDSKFIAVEMGVG